MSTESSFQFASERAEGWLLTVHLIADLGERDSVDSAYQLLEFLHNEYSQHGTVLNGFVEKLRPLSDEQIKWPQERGWSAIVEAGTVSCWSSAHEAAIRLVEMALEMLFYPVVSDTTFDPKKGAIEHTPITDSDEQWNRAEKLLSERWKAFVIPREEVASLQERIRRERAKLLGQNHKTESADESEWSVQKPKSKWQNLLRLSSTTWGIDVREKKLIIDTHGREKRCRIRMDCLRNIFGNEEAEKYI